MTITLTLSSCFETTQPRLMGVIDGRISANSGDGRRKRPLCKPRVKPEKRNAILGMMIIIQLGHLEVFERVMGTSP
jgi:hypothetical protein